MEIGIAIGLLTRLWPGFSKISFLLLCMFLAYTIWAYLDNQEAHSCGCFGSFNLNDQGHFSLLVGAIFLCFACYHPPASSVLSK